jgi:hypothetical protein
MTTEQDRIWPRNPENEKLKNGSFREREIIARKAARQVLEWVLKETENLLTY